MNNLTREKYIKLPKQGTNPRGIKIQNFAMKSLIENKKTYKIPISWQKEKIKFNPFKRWVEYWEMN